MRSSDALHPNTSFWFHLYNIMHLLHFLYYITSPINRDFFSIICALPSLCTLFKIALLLQDAVFSIQIMPVLISFVKLLIIRDKSFYLRHFIIIWYNKSKQHFFVQKLEVNMNFGKQGIIQRKNG